jgi:flavin reductase (NADH)
LYGLAKYVARVAVEITRAAPEFRVGLMGGARASYCRSMTRKRIGKHLEGGRVPDEERARRAAGDAMRDAFSRWPSGVSIVAVREGGRIHALTVSAFIPVSVEPPLVLVSLGGNASVLPYLDPGTPFGISILSATQKGLASRFADVLPVGPDPFDPGDPPLVRDAVAALGCVVEEVRPAGDHHLVTGRVEEVRPGGDAPALVYYRREYGSAG